MTQPERLRLAVFIDFDNIEIGVKNTLNTSFDPGIVLEALKERGEVVSKMAYSDWQRAGGYSRALTQHAIRMVQRNMTPGGDKNGADINLALDALEMAFTHPHINAFAIVGGDSDFISLVEKLKQYDKKVFVVGGRQFTSAIMQRNCHEFIAYENLANVSAGPSRRAQGQQARSERAGAAAIEQAIPLVKRALKVLSERDVEPQLGLFKSTMLQLDSTFSERTYGAGSFRDFAQKLEKAGVLSVEHTRGGWIVGPANGTATIDAPASDGTGAAAPPADAQGPDGAGAVAPPASAAPGKLGTTADGVRELAAILASAAIRKWPLYLRNVKQVIKQARPEFDERAYGFANLADLLRAAHRDNLVRVDRDRQGVIRVFQGSAAPAASPTAPARPGVYDVEDDPNLAEDLARAHGLAGTPANAAAEPAASAPPGGEDAAAAVDAREGSADLAGVADAPAGKKGRRRRSPSQPSGPKTGRTRRPAKSQTAKA